MQDTTNVHWKNHMHILRYFIELKYYTDVHTYSYDKNVDINQ